MANVFVRLGDCSVLDAAVAAGCFDIMRLFQNNHVPAESDVIGDYTVATFGGYPGDTAPAWDPAFVNGSNKGEINADPVTFTKGASGASNTIYGVYFVDAAGVLVYAERFPAPYSMATNGDTFTYTPKATAVHE